MRNIFYSFFCILFFAICCFFSLGMLIPGAAESTDTAGTVPALFDQDGLNHDFGDEFETWFSEHFAFRNAAVDLFSELKTTLLLEGSDQVIVGKDGFLFFEETVANYTGTDPMSEEEIDAAASALALVAEEIKESGAQFLFVCAPNKNTVYGEMMPDRYLEATEASNLDRLYNRLDEYGVPYRDLRTALSQAAKTELVYHKRDSHWNGAGALTAFSEIAEALSFEMPDLAGRGPTEVFDFAGDLDALLFPGKTKYDRDVTYNFEGLHIYTSAYNTPMDMTITTRGVGDGKLLVFRDSFANALIPYAASAFAEARFERAVPYQTDLANSFSADYVIVEIAERNLRNLIEYCTSEQK